MVKNHKTSLSSLESLKNQQSLASGQFNPKKKQDIMN
jgi:hypothetical protein